MAGDVKRWQRARLTHPEAAGRLVWVRYQTNVTEYGSVLCVRADQLELLDEFADDVELVTKDRFLREEPI